VLPALEVVCPPGHASHAAFPVAFLKVPTAHGAHVSTVVYNSTAIDVSVTPLQVTCQGCSGGKTVLL